MPHQTVQLLPVHAAQRVQGEGAGHRVFRVGAVLGLARQLGVPGEPRKRVARRSAGGDHAVRPALLQDHRLQVGDG